MIKKTLVFAVAFITSFVIAADSLESYIKFCKAEFKFEFCGVDDSIAASRVPISQKFVEAQFSSKYDMSALRKIQYDHLVQFELAVTNRESYRVAMSNLIADVEYAFTNSGLCSVHKFNFLHLIKMIEFSIARINEANKTICVAPCDIDKILPLKMFERCDGNDSAIKRYGMMRDLLIVGAYISTFKKSTGHIPLTIGDMEMEEGHANRTKYIKYIGQGEEWQLIAAHKKLDTKLIEFDTYVPLIMGLPVRFWKFDFCVILSSNFSKKRKDLYKGKIVNDGTAWACLMDGGQVIPCAMMDSK